MIAAGAAADVLVVDGDPTTDVTILGDRRRIRHVFSRGRAVDLARPWPDRRPLPGRAGRDLGGPAAHLGHGARMSPCRAGGDDRAPGGGRHRWRAGAGCGDRRARPAAEWTVGVLDRDGDAADAHRAALGRGAVALVADTTDEDAVDAALDRFGRRSPVGPRPDVVVRNAGIVRFGPLLDLDARRLALGRRRQPHRHLRHGPSGGPAAGRGGMRPGSIVTVTSMNGVAPGPNAGRLRRHQGRASRA